MRSCSSRKKPGQTHKFLWARTIQSSREKWISGTCRVSCWWPIQAKCCSQSGSFAKKCQQSLSTKRTKHAQSADTQSDDAASNTPTCRSSTRVKRAPERLKDYIVENMLTLSIHVSIPLCSIRQGSCGQIVKHESIFCLFIWGKIILEGFIKLVLMFVIECYILTTVLSLVSLGK